jgi:uncharacterized protein
MAKRKIRKPKDGSKVLKYIAWILAVIALILSSVIIGYYFGYDQGGSNTLKQEKEEVKRRLSRISVIEKSLKKDNQKTVEKRLQEVLGKERKSDYLSSSHEIDDSVVAPPEAIERPMKLLSVKPKLAIIIDDVGTRSQVNDIKSLKLSLTMSFLPPSANRPNTPKLAARENFYMIHLPMEAQSFTAEEPFTLRVLDSQDKISQRIGDIKKLFPRVKYINNHTGSKFTASEVAMNKLIYSLSANHINFVDSRTTADTKAPKVLKNFGFRYVARDVFLDHHMEKDYVASQIKEAVKIAKLHGSAIAIGHPHPNTLQALRESKKLLDEVDLVYIYQIY